MKRLSIFLILIMSINSCMFEGNVYVCVQWYNEDPSNIPASISHNIPNLPQTIAAIKPGAYYQTLPGNYSFQTDYNGTLTAITVNLAVKKTALGVEDSYYDIVCKEDIGPFVNRVPAY